MNEKVCRALYNFRTLSFRPAELSLYELHRKPHEMVTDSTVVAVSPRALRSELMCPICLDLMKTPLTTKEVSLLNLFVHSCETFLCLCVCVIRIVYKFHMLPVCKVCIQ